jgi:hypothetical protein
MLPDASQLRLLRQDRGWDVPEMARRLRRAADGQALPSQAGLARMIRRWEAGGVGISERYQLLYRHALGLTPGDAHTASTTARAREPSQAPAEGDSHVQRREFLTRTAVLAGSLAAPPQFASLAAGHRIGADMPAVLAQRLARLRNLDDYLGGSQTYALYAAELEATRTLAREAACTSEVRRQLLSLVSEQAQQAGWAAFDAGWQATARALYTESLDAARAAADRALEGNALALLAYQNLTTGDPADGLAAASCQAVHPGVPPAVRAPLHERRAWAIASTPGGSPGTVLRALDPAAAALGEAGGDPAPDWAAWVNPAELQIMTGRCLTRLRQPRRAISVLNSALSGFDNAKARDKALYLSWLAEAHLDFGDIAAAAVITSQIIQLAAGVGSARPAERAGMLIHRLRPHAHASPVAAVLGQAAQLMPPTASG